MTKERTDRPYLKLNLHGDSGFGNNSVSLLTHILKNACLGVHIIHTWMLSDIQLITYTGVLGRTRLFKCLQSTSGARIDTWLNTLVLIQCFSVLFSSPCKQRTCAKTLTVQGSCTTSALYRRLKLYSFFFLCF